MLKYCFFPLFLFLFIVKVLSVDYITDQSSQLINQFLLNPESIVSNTGKLLAIAQYISKTLETNQTSELKLNPNITLEESAKTKKIGIAKINTNYFVTHKTFIKNNTYTHWALCEGTIQVYKRAESLHFFSKSLKTPIIQSGVLYNQNTGIFFHGDVKLGKIKALNSFRANSFLAQETKQWNLISHDDFDYGVHQWNFNKTNRCSVKNSNYFLGGHCNLASDEVSKGFFNVKPHESIRIQGTFHMFDNWEGELGYMRLDDKIVWTQTGHNLKRKTINLCGNEDFDDPHMNLKIDKVLNHSNPNFTLTFGTNLNKNPCEASFAIDDIIIYIK